MGVELAGEARPLGTFTVALRQDTLNALALLVTRCARQALNNLNRVVLNPHS